MATNQNSRGGQGSDQSKQQKGDTSKRGFASMDPEKQREIASKGGKASHGGRSSSDDKE